jgi:mRNA interferase MazF
VKGDVVLILFPFSDALNAKYRPALVVATLPGDDVVLCMITSQTTSDSDAISLAAHADFQQGHVSKDSSIRPNRLFTGDHRRGRWVGRVKPEKLQEVTQTLVAILTR